MPKAEPFAKYTKEYEDWSERNKLAYFPELQAIKSQLPENNHSSEIGVGSCRFAASLGIKSAMILTLSNRRT